ncbi:MAG TPA: PAS-domain containing protein [Rhizomicrobium sp.]|jgi:PAS domain-containing protein|nr:PAS-domain containing protein [Rhizomicrobium sp.]
MAPFLFAPFGAFAAMIAVPAGTLAALSLASCFVGFLSTGWALRLRMRLDHVRRGTGMEKARAEALAAFHSALLDNAPQGVVVSLGHEQRYFGNGKMLFELLMESPDAPQAMQAMDRLSKEGTLFTLSARVPGGYLALRGAPIGKHTALYISELPRDEDSDARMIDHLPVAVAAFDASRKLTRYNTAFARLWDLPDSWLEVRPTLGDILNHLREKRLIPEQRNFAEWRRSRVEAAPAAGEPVEETWHLPSGKSIRIVTRSHWDGGIFMLCEDISEKLKLESSLNLLTQVQKATLDTLDEGVAIFGTDGRLVLHNALFAKMWRLTESDLAGQPHLGMIAQLCSRRIGHDGIWSIVASGVSAAAPERFGEWGKAKRADGRIISLALSRLPNGATMASFVDLTDLEKFHQLQRTASHSIVALKYHQSA